jgi:hypothetical protein
MRKLTHALIFLLGAVVLAGCSATATTVQMPPLSFMPVHDFETTTLNAAPQDFDVAGPAAVTDEQARSGNRSVKLTRLNVDENVRLRQHFGARQAGLLKVSLYVPNNVQVDTFVTLFQDSYRADPDRIIDVIFRANSDIRNREAGGQVAIGKFHKGTWNDIEINWQNLATNNTYSLKVNGSLIGNFAAERPGMVPARLDIKYGAGSSPIGSASLYLDALTIH